MFDDRMMKFVGIALLVGGLTVGCSTGDDDDATGDDDATQETTATPGPEATPEYLSIDSITAECDEATNQWYYEMSVTGWAEEYPYVLVYDNPEWGYSGPDDPSLWVEDISLDTLLEQGGDSTNAGYYEVWARDDLQYVADASDYEEDVTTIFRCENYDFLTFVFYASDYWDGVEDCFAMGYMPDTFGSGCYY